MYMCIHLEADMYICIYLKKPRRRRTGREHINKRRRREHINKNPDADARTGWDGQTLSLVCLVQCVQFVCLVLSHGQGAIGSTPQRSPVSEYS
jgi:hypothetical protein